MGRYRQESHSATATLVPTGKAANRIRPEFNVPPRHLRLSHCEREPLALEKERANTEPHRAGPRHVQLARRAAIVHQGKVLLQYTVGKDVPSTYLPQQRRPGSIIQKP